MSITTEIVTLEGIDLENSPPCEAALDRAGTRKCGLPSAFRVRATECWCRMGSETYFFCTAHKEALEGNKGVCTSCGSDRFLDQLL